MKPDFHLGLQHSTGHMLFTGCHTASHTLNIWKHLLPLLFILPSAILQKTWYLDPSYPGCVLMNEIHLSISFLKHSIYKWTQYFVILGYQGFRYAGGQKSKLKVRWAAKWKAEEGQSSQCMQKVCLLMVHNSEVLGWGSASEAKGTHIFLSVTEKVSKAQEYMNLQIFISKGLFLVEEEFKKWPMMGHYHELLSSSCQALGVAGISI